MRVKEREKECGRKNTKKEGEREKKSEREREREREKKGIVSVKYLVREKDDLNFNTSRVVNCFFEDIML